jgi:hypothetical protein
MAHRWETARSVWLEDEHSGQFELAESFGLDPDSGTATVDWNVAAGRAADVAELLGASLPLACSHSRIYPEGFAFCPECGKPLTQPAAPVLPEWWGAGAGQALPKHVPQGLPVTALALADGIESRPADLPLKPDLTLPAAPNAICVFAAARFGYAAQRLLALAYTRNVLQYWDPTARLWHVMAPQDGSAGLAFSASDYGWLPALSTSRRGEVAIVPASTGLVRLLIDPVGETYRTEPVFDGTLVSAPGATRLQIACLVAGTAGPCLWTASPDGADAALLACEGTEGAEGVGIPASGWSRPLYYDGKLVWLHESGHLAWLPGAQPQWMPWPEGWAPRRNFGGPVQSRDGRLWLIGHDGHAYSFLELGVARGQIEAIAGARLGFGTLLFRRGHPVLNDPWDTETVEDQSENESLVLPLLQNFNGVRNQPAGLVLRFDKYTGRVESALDSLVIQKTVVEWIGRRNVPLDDIIRLARPAECQPFVYDDCLWLHHPDWNRIRGWRLKAAS